MKKFDAPLVKFSVVLPHGQFVNRNAFTPAQRDNLNEWAVEEGRKAGLVARAQVNDDKFVYDPFSNQWLSV